VVVWQGRTKVDLWLRDASGTSRRQLDSFPSNSGSTYQIEEELTLDVGKFPNARTLRSNRGPGGFQIGKFANVATFIGSTSHTATPYITHLPGYLDEGKQSNAGASWLEVCHGALLQRCKILEILEQSWDMASRLQEVSSPHPN
jgi:hypothetical protein